MAYTFTRKDSAAGGRARAKKLGKRRRKASAKAAAKARWAKFHEARARAEQETRSAA